MDLAGLGSPHLPLQYLAASSPSGMACLPLVRLYKLFQTPPAQPPSGSAFTVLAVPEFILSPASFRTSTSPPPLTTTHTVDMADSTEKRDSWWKRHCTAPPPATRNVMCPCTSCWQNTPVYDPSPVLSQRPPVSHSSSFSSTSSTSSNTTSSPTANRLDDDSDTTPLFRPTTSASTWSEARPRQSDELSLAAAGPARMRETL
jgi:hypothetical protein